MMINEDVRLLAHKLCSEFLSDSWKNVSPSDICMEPISGGLSNVLYRCSLPSFALSSKKSPPNQILLRFYGQSCDNDATTGSVIFMLLSERKLGPKLYGVFNGGRLEEYLPARPITQLEEKTWDVSAAIARKIADIHNLEVPINKQPGWLFDRYQEWLDFIEENGDIEKTLATIQNRSNYQLKIVREVLEYNFKEELQWLKKIVTRSNSPTVFSHNDLLRGNILIREESDIFKTFYQRLVLIDFEYCSYNYRGFDIACHFCEWCFDYDLPDEEPFGDMNSFPNEEFLRKFVHEYLDQSRRLSNHSLPFDSARDSGMVSPCNLSTNSSSNDKNISINSEDGACSSMPSRLDKNFSFFQSNSIWDKSKIDSINPRSNDVQVNNIGNFSKASTVNQFNSCITKQDEDLLIEEIQPFVQAAHLLWTLWAIKNAYCSKIQFNYWKMAWEKLNFYIETKKIYQSKSRN